MSWMDVAAGLLGAALLAYLFAVLVDPERFD
ncbi:MAG: potassium-transporting ATPase subunit F [Bacteroidota bacterium]